MPETTESGQARASGFADASEFVDPSRDRRHLDARLADDLRRVLDGRPPGRLPRLPPDVRLALLLRHDQAVSRAAQADRAGDAGEAARLRADAEELKVDWLAYGRNVAETCMMALRLAAYHDREALVGVLDDLAAESPVIAALAQAVVNVEGRLSALEGRR